MVNKLWPTLEKEHIELLKSIDFFFFKCLPVLAGDPDGRIIEHRIVQDS